MSRKNDYGKNWYSRDNKNNKYSLLFKKKKMVISNFLQKKEGRYKWINLEVKRCYNIAQWNSDDHYEIVWKFISR